MNRSFSEYIQRRDELVKDIQKMYPRKKGAVVLFSGFESETCPFRQDSTFYYYTGLSEPGCVLVLTLEGKATLWVPQYGSSRSRWTATIVEADAREAKKWGINEVKHLGHPCKGVISTSACDQVEYEHLLAELEALHTQGLLLFADYPAYRNTVQKMVIDRLFIPLPHLSQAITDISPLISSMRRIKSRLELEYIYEAVDCTMQAQEAAALRMEQGLYEYQIQAAVEFVFKEAGGSPAFPTIVASGKQALLLHYQNNNKELKDGDLVIVDCGAEIGHYCADITRTYPVSGTFTSRQREVYDVVLEAQHIVAQHAQPGFWLNNAQEPAKSLQHIAQSFFKEKGYAHYFTHAIGHFLGLDVHDCGAESGPLQEGDVITLEPGLYIPEESIGIRIEDVYWITNKEAACVSEELPRDSYEIEQMMAGDLSDDYETL